MPAVFSSTVTRSFLGPSTISAGEQVIVRLDIIIDDNSTYYTIDEVYPSGWTYVGAVQGTAAGNASYTPHIRWVNLNPANNPLIYNLTAVGTSGTYSFSGNYSFENNATEFPIQGPATASISSSCADSFDCNFNEYCNAGVCAGTCQPYTTDDGVCCRDEPMDSPDCGGGMDDFFCNFLGDNISCSLFSSECTWTGSMCNGANPLNCSLVTDQGACNNLYQYYVPLECKWNSSLNAGSGGCQEEVFACTDNDGDGYDGMMCSTGTDCDDWNPYIYPNQSLENNTINPGSCYDYMDNDCDGIIDDQDSGCGGSGTAQNCTGNDDCGYAQSCKASTSSCLMCDPWSWYDNVCCNGEEGYWDPSADCYDDDVVCGNSICEPGEDIINCWSDCGGGGQDIPCNYNCSACANENECYSQSLYTACEWDGSSCNLQSGFDPNNCMPGSCDDTNHKFCDGNATWISGGYCSFCYSGDGYCNQPCSATTGVCGACYDQNNCQSAGCTWDTSDIWMPICVPNGTINPFGGNGGGPMGNPCDIYSSMSTCELDPGCVWEGDLMGCQPQMQFNCGTDCEACDQSGCLSRSSDCEWSTSSNECYWKDDTWGGSWIQGDGICDYAQGESEWSSPLDCNSSNYVAFCGNGMCESSENDTSCPVDCDFSGSFGYCGDNICDGPETFVTCPMDCLGGVNTLTCQQECGACDTKSQCQQNENCFWDPYWFNPQLGAQTGGCMWEMGAGFTGEMDGCEWKMTETECNASAAQGMPCEWVTDPWGYSFCDYSMGKMDFSMIFGGNDDFMCENIATQTECAMIPECFWDSGISMCMHDFGMGAETCDNACWACENLSAADGGQSNCEASNLNGGGFCEWHTDSYSPSGGFCAPDMQFDMGKGFFGGSTCDTDCFACDFQGQSACEASPASCKWFSDDYGGWCDPSWMLTCAEDCMQCYSSNDCLSTGRPFINNATNTSGSCEWDQQMWMCKPQGVNVEICFIPGDEDGDGAADCDDSDCAQDPMCGFGMFGFTDMASTGMQSDCWVHDGDESACNSTTGCFYHDVPTPFGPQGLCDPEFMNKMFEGFEQGAPIPLGSDTLGETSQQWLDIAELAMRDNPEKFGFGIVVNTIDDFAQCGFYTNGLNKTGKYYYYLDSDGITTGGCTPSDDAGKPGFEYKLEYVAAYNGSSLSENRTAYRCSSGNWTPASVTLMGKKDEGCEHNAVILSVDKASLQFSNLVNTSKDMRIYVTTANSTGNAASIIDEFGPIYYTPGTIDFKVEDCMAVGNVDLDGDNKTGCDDPDCYDFCNFGFVPFEDCWSPEDDDSDGKTNCDDEDCKWKPECGVFEFIADASDTTSPSVTFKHVDTFPDFAFISYDTSEPANGSVLFYSLNKTCEGSVNTTVLDWVLTNQFQTDDYTLWHDAPLDDTTLNGWNLSSNSSYYYKIKVCDPSSNCGTSACFNFTTASGFKAFKTNFDFMPPSGLSATDPLGNMDFMFKFPGDSNFTEQNFTGGGMNLNYSQGVDMKMTNENSTMPWEFEFSGVDFMKATNMNLTGAIIIDNNSGKITIGIDPTKWGSIVSDLSPNNITIGIPMNGTDLFKCNDAGAACINVTNVSTMADPYNDSTGLTRWTIPISLGFSTYTQTPPSPFSNRDNAVGWNLVSLPIAISDQSPAAVMDSIDGKYDTIWVYVPNETAANAWKVYVPDGVHNVKALNETIGFWIRMNASETFSVEGTVLSGATTVPLLYGWNLIGYPSNTPQPVGTVLSSIAGKYTTVWKYDESISSDPDLNWKAYIVNGPNNIGNMTKNFGYWIYVNQTGLTTLSITA